MNSEKKIEDIVYDKIINGDKLDSLSNIEKLQIISYLITSASDYIFKTINISHAFIQEELSYIIKSDHEDYSDDFNDIWNKMLSSQRKNGNLLKNKSVDLGSPINIGYGQCLDAEISGGAFDKAIVLSLSLFGDKNYFFRESKNIISTLTIVRDLKSQFYELVRYYKYSSMLLRVIDYKIDELSSINFSDALSLIDSYANNCARHLKVNANRNFYMENYFEEHTLRRFFHLTDRLSLSDIIIDDNYNLSALEYHLRHNSTQRVEVIRDIGLLKKFFSKYKTHSSYINDTRYWCSSLKKILIEEIFEFHGVDFLQEKNLNKIGINASWLPKKHKTALYKAKGLFNCVDEMIKSKDCDIRYLAAISMPPGDPRFKTLISDRSKKVFLVALEKCSKEVLSFMITSNKIKGNTARSILNKRLQA